MKVFNKKNAVIGLLAATAMSATASEVVPIHYINSFDVQASQVVMSAEKASWKVAHSCDLFVESASEVKVRPAHKTHPMPHRMNRVATYDSLVITVDGKKHVCQVEGIERTTPTLAAN